MVSMKINRVNLLELATVNVRCARCGFGLILDLESSKFGMARCPSCSADFGRDAEEAYYRARDALLAAKAGAGRFSIEFDIPEAPE